MSTRYKKSPYTARVMLCPRTSLRAATLCQANLAVQREVHGLCLRRCGDSRFRLSMPSSVTKFSWVHIVDELKARAPVLYSILKASLSERGRIIPKSAIGIAASVLLKHRNRQLAFIQAVISIVMYAGHCSKQVCCY